MKETADDSPFYDEANGAPAGLHEILELEEIEKIFTHFFQLAKLDVALFDQAGREILGKRKADSLCEAAGNCEKCREHIAAGGTMAADIGEPYIFYCGCGLVMCSAPILFDKRLMGSIVCGPAVLWDVDEVAVAELSRKLREMGINLEAGEVFRNMPPYGCDTISSAAQMLFIIVNNITRGQSAYLRQRAQITEQQAKISALITDHKIAAANIIRLEKHAAASSYPVEIEKELIAFVQSGNKPRAVFILNNLLSEIFSLSDGNMDTIRVKIFELIAFLSRSAFDAGAPLEEIRDITQSSFEVCSGNTDFEKICFLTTRALERFIDTVYQHRKQNPVGEHLSRAIDYIMAHYAEELNLGTVAAAIYVSPYYLSHLFRKEMDTTFSNYICKARVNKAKEFLKEHKNLNIQEISEKAGFNDPNYFSVIFKKMTGVTPKEYRAFFK